MLIAEQVEVQTLSGCPPEIGLVFDHVGVVVEELEQGRRFARQALGIERWTVPVRDDGIGVRVQFGSALRGPCYELIEPLGTDSPVAGALRSGRHILNHIAYRVADFEAAAQWLEGMGCTAIAPPQPAAAYGGKPVQFWMTPLRFLLEIVGAAGHQHRFGPQPEEFCGFGQGAS